MKKIIITVGIILILGYLFIHFFVNINFNQLSKTEKDEIRKGIVSGKYGVETIDIRKMDSLINANNKLKWIVFFTSSCKGTPYTFKEVKKAESDSSKIDIILISSNDYYNIDEIKPLLDSFKISSKCYIVDESFGVNFDDRQRCSKLKEHLSPELKNEPPGVPYSTLVQKNKVLFKDCILRGGFQFLMQLFDKIKG